MSAKVNQAGDVEMHRAQSSAVASSSSTSSISSSKASMYKGKTGFVIPKNKFSGSLVPIFKGGKKSETGDATGEESKQMQRKTKWGADLTQDTNVKRGRALAYQTRVDQITQQLKLGSLSADNQNSKSTEDVPGSELSSAAVDYEKLQVLELERREAIEEMLKLNPSYKAPSDYQPLMRETTVSIPVKEHPEYNFVGLIYGIDGDTHKRLEKETGTKIQVCGTKFGTEEKIEIPASAGTEILSFCSDVYVQISAETFEKVDAAASLIEMLLSTVSGNSAAPKASASLSEENAEALDEAKATATEVSTFMTSQELVRPIMGPPASTSLQGHFQPYPPGQWFPTRSEFTPVPTSTAFTFNPQPMRPGIGPRLTPPYGFDKFPQNFPVGSPMLHPSMQGLNRPFVNPLGQTGPPRNHSTATSPLVQQPTAMGSPRVPAPQLVQGQRPFTPTASSPGWAMPPLGSSQGTMVSQSVSPLPPPLSIMTEVFPSAQVAPTSAPQFVSSQIQSSSFVSQVNLSANMLPKPAQSPLPPPASYGSHSGMSSPAIGTLNEPSFTPLRPPLQGSSDFTFQQQHMPRGPSHSSMNFSSQRLPPPPPLPRQLPPSQLSSFRPALQNPTQQQQHVGPNYSRPQMGNQMGPPPSQYGARSPNPPHMGMGSRNFGPQMPNSGGHFPPRGGHSTQYQENYPASPLGRPGNPFVPNQQHSRPSGRLQQQIYDPFSPTSVSAQGTNIAATRKQESDPEYEDLMAQVGVK